MTTPLSNCPNGIFLSLFSKLVCVSTLFLIFVGSLVTSTGSGLAVPDWPLSYGTLFPPMVGGIFYEHSHRMVASLVGFLTLCLAVCLARVEKRRWVKYLGFAALAVVILQGLLGGITVLFLLPKPISISHGILAQTFFILTIIIAYSQSAERLNREIKGSPEPVSKILWDCSIIFALIYVQLIIGAIMRHTSSGLAIPDFPQMGGSFLPGFDEKMLININWHRFQMNLPSVIMPQIMIHFGHRLWAGLILIWVVVLTIKTFRYYTQEHQMFKTVLILDAIILIQVGLGIATVLSEKFYTITSAHVATGALALGFITFLLLRVSPLSIKNTAFCFPPTR